MHLTATKITKRINGRHVVNNVSLTVDHEIVGLLGPNGAGKTTTFYAIAGLIQPDSGIIRLNNTDITHMPTHQRAQVGLGYLPQEASIFRQLTVSDNIMAILQLRKQLSDAQRVDKLEALLHEFEMSHLRNTLGQQLSGGERRRVEIARTLAADPSCILLDEPFAGIDPRAINDIKNIIQALHKRGISILITDHNARETLSICHRAHIMSQGQLMISGTPDEILANSAAREVYLGDGFRM